MIQTEYDLLLKIQNTPHCSDDDLSDEEHAFLKNCRFEHWVFYHENHFFWEVSSRGEAAMLQFEYLKKCESQRETQRQRQERFNNVLLVATFILSLLSFLVALFH